MKNILALSFALGFTATLQAATVNISVLGGRFAPEHVQIQTGDTLLFTNQTKGVHTVTADPTLVRDPHNVLLPSGATPFHSGALKPGATFTQTFSVAGDYAYVCLPHERMGMQGTITVVEPK